MQALANAQLRSTVDDCLRDMLTDVELSALLEDRLVTEHEIQRLKTQLLERDWALEETKVLRKERAVKERKLANDMVKELWSLSQQLGELKDVKKQHQELLVQYDEVIAKLIQTEEELQEAREMNQQRDKVDDAAKTTDVDSGTATAPKADEGDVEEDAPVVTENLSGITKESIPEDGAETEKAPVSSDLGEESKDEIVESTLTPPVAILSEGQPRVAEEPTAAPAPAAVVTLEQESEPETPRLDQLDNKILMIIFAYLDALDILNVAQINISMYSRVDSLFGLGGGEPDGDNSTIATNETAPSTQPTVSVTTSQPSTSTAQPTATSATGTFAAIPPKAPTTSTTTPTATATTTGTTTASTTKPRPVAIATDPQKHQNVVGPVNAANEGLRGILSMLQPNRKPSGGPRSPLRNRSPSLPSSESAPPMNAAMANSMAAKLSDAELNAIIVMTERLRQKEILVESLLKEREDLAAKLDGTESVKQFLIAKVRDMEEAIQAQEDNELKVAQQIASDQEVIAFLDGRVQELERQVALLKKDQRGALDELARVKEQAEQKGIVMGDMLQFERERWNESEREWKATKKVLVKEVKSCRAQIVTLQAERDGYREQNDLLRKAVLATPATKNSLSRDHSFA